jgi:hypothetical protein
MLATKLREVLVHAAGAPADRHAAEGRAHQHARADHLGPGQREVRSDRRAEVMAHDVGLFNAEFSEELRGILDQIEHAELREIAVVTAVPAGGASVAALIGRDQMEARVGKPRHDFAPAKGELGKAVQQEHRGPACIARLEDVHAKAVDTFDEA